MRYNPVAFRERRDNGVIKPLEYLGHVFLATRGGGNVTCRQGRCHQEGRKRDKKGKGTSLILTVRGPSANQLNATNRSVDRSRDGRSRPQSWKRSPTIVSQGRRLRRFRASAGRGTQALSGGSADLLPDAQPLASCRQAADRRGVGPADGLGGCDVRPPAPRALSRRGARHLDQGRFKRFPVAEDDDFLMLCR